MTNQGKLVRDKIPQIIRAQGGDPIVRIAEAVEYRELLRAKLAEEVGEVLAADDTDAPEELVDVLEVVLALAVDPWDERAPVGEPASGQGRGTRWLHRAHRVVRQRRVLTVALDGGPWPAQLGPG